MKLKGVFFWKCKCGTLHPVLNRCCMECGTFIDDAEKMSAQDYTLTAFRVSYPAQMSEKQVISLTHILLRMLHDAPHPATHHLKRLFTSNLFQDSAYRIFAQAVLAIVQDAQNIPAGCK